jgi:hypothetical protein
MDKIQTPSDSEGGNFSITISRENDVDLSHFHSVRDFIFEKKKKLVYMLAMYFVSRTNKEK